MGLIVLMTGAARYPGSVPVRTGYGAQAGRSGPTSSDPTVWRPIW